MTKADTLAPQIEDLGHRLAKAREMIRGVFIGQERVVDLVLITLLCGGHGVARQSGAIHPGFDAR